MKFCTNCGAEIAEESKFCSNCGTKYEEAQTEYDEIWGQSELDIKYEEDTDTGVAAYSNDAYQTPTVSSYTQSYESSVTTQSGNGNIGLSIAAMVCGIVSLVCCCLWYFSIILAIAAIVLGIISIKNDYEGKGMAIAGLITGGVTIFALIVLLILGGVTTFLDW